MSTKRDPFGPRPTTFRLSAAAAAIRDLDLGDVPAVEEAPLLLGPSPDTGEGVSIESGPLFSGTLAPMGGDRVRAFARAARRAER